MGGEDDPGAEVWVGCEWESQVSEAGVWAFREAEWRCVITSSRANADSSISVSTLETYRDSYTCFGCITSSLKIHTLFHNSSPIQGGILYRYYVEAWFSFIQCVR